MCYRHGSRGQSDEEGAFEHVGGNDETGGNRVALSCNGRGGRFPGV